MEALSEFRIKSLWTIMEKTDKNPL